MTRTIHRTYDDWKTDSGYEDDDRPIGECDCCGKQRPLSRCWYLGYMETFACDECQGDLEPKE